MLGCFFMTMAYCLNIMATKLKEDILMNEQEQELWMWNEWGNDTLAQNSSQT